MERSTAMSPSANGSSELGRQSISKDEDLVKEPFAEASKLESHDMAVNIDILDQYGHVQRGLKSRHVQFIALGGAIGTGLFLGIGRALVKAGPLSLTIGYTFVGLAIYAMMMSLGEMATWLPLPGAIPQFCARYVDDALGFAVGWNTWFTAVITLCAEIAAVCSLIQFWEGARDINISAWIVLLIALVLIINVFAVGIYGEAEFVFASIKVLAILGLLILGLVIDLGGAPTHDRLGFRYWKNPGAMKEYIAVGDTGRFLGLWSTFVNAAFSFGGIEMVAVAAGEAENPRHNVPKAVRRVFWRILFFYVLGSFMLGLICPSNDSNLLGAIANGAPGAAQSPWVIAIHRASIPALPSIINAVIITSASSAANAFVYTGSRYLYALAQNGQAPKLFLRCTAKGVPLPAVIATTSISLLTFMTTSAGSATVFQWFQNLTTISNLFTWMSVCVAYIRFHAALKAQHVDRSQMYYRSPFQPYLAWAGLAFFALITFFNGWDSIAGGWDYQLFITSYIGFPVFFGLFIFWKVFKKTTWKSSDEADIFSGKAALDAIEWPKRVPRNMLERVWFWIA